MNYIKTTLSWGLRDYQAWQYCRIKVFLGSILSDSPVFITWRVVPARNLWTVKVATCATAHRPLTKLVNFPIISEIASSSLEFGSAPVFKSFWNEGHFRNSLGVSVSRFHSRFSSYHWSPSARSNCRLRATQLSAPDVPRRNATDDSRLRRPCSERVPFILRLGN